MKKDSLSITYSELMKTLDKFRLSRTNTRVLTKEQKNFLIASRQNPNPVPFKIMSDLWIKVGWGKMSSTSLQRIYNTQIKPKEK